MTSAKRDDNDDGIDFYLEDDEPSEQRTPCSFLTGSAGTGKSFEIARRIEADPNYALVCATTGISAINLGEGVTTINSALGYFDTESLMDNYINGRVTARLNKLAKMGYKNIVIDEASMMSAEQLDIIVKAMDDLNAYEGMRDREPMGLVLTGDFCQLPAIKAKQAFEAQSWPRFAANTTRLTKCWRQSNEQFQKALGAARAGEGPRAVYLLDYCNIHYADNNQLEFPGTTIVSKNDEVERFNWACQAKVNGRMTITQSKRWGKQRQEWKIIPESLKVKIGDYVMILTNQKAGFALFSDGFEFVNGDCGHVIDFDSTSNIYQVKLKRDERIVRVTQITRRNEQKEKPEDWQLTTDDGDERPYYDSEKKRWVIGAVTYSPLRLAYASTCHKSQGLSLDAVQVNISNSFFGFYAMAYVALSRCRDASGLRIVGSRDLLAKRISTDPKVRQFL